MLHHKKEDESKAGNLTYYAKEQFECPVCKTKFKKEELHQGGGRLIAADLTDELHRTYTPSVKYGEVIPLLYQVVVCPKCYYAGFPGDFRLPSSAVIAKLFESTQNRYSSMHKLFSKLDFSDARTICEGAASYYLAIMCYSLFALCVRHGFLNRSTKKNQAKTSNIFRICFMKRRCFFTERLFLTSKRDVKLCRVQKTWDPTQTKTTAMTVCFIFKPFCCISTDIGMTLKDVQKSWSGKKALSQKCSVWAKLQKKNPARF